MPERVKLPRLFQETMESYKKEKISQTLKAMEVYPADIEATKNAIKVAITTCSEAKIKEFLELMLEGIELHKDDLITNYLWA